jgi:drug/metabolite transporter (DMT)-like permease
VRDTVKNPAGGGGHGASGVGDVGPKLMLVLLCCIWGVTWPVMKIALHEIPPFSMRTITTALGAIALGGFCVFKRVNFYIPSARAWLHVAVASVLNLVGFAVLTSFAQLHASTSRVAILAYTMPIWAAFLAWPFLGERPTGVKAVALGLCAAGLAILIYPLTESGFPLGIALALATGISWAAGTVYLKWARIDADPMAVATWQLVIAFFVIAACMMAFEGGFKLAVAGAPALWATAFTGVVGNGVAYGLWFTIVGRLPAMTASLGVLGSPVIGVISSMLILGDRPTATDLIGFALIFAASACVLLTRQAPAEATP